MHTPTSGSVNKDDGRTPQPRQSWATPSIERRGSVADLVLATKLSGGDDSSGNKHQDPGQG